MNCLQINRNLKIDGVINFSAQAGDHGLDKPSGTGCDAVHDGK